MAKKKADTEKAEEAGNLTITDFVGRIRAEINKKFGAGTCITAQEVLDRKLLVIPWSPSLNAGLGGGIEEGSWVSIQGDCKTGKTTTLLTLAANAQKMGKVVFFLNVEGRFKKMNLTGNTGLDISDDKLVIIESSPGNVMTTQKYMEVLEMILKSFPGCFIIIDSVSALADDKEIVGGLGTETRGHNQKVITQFINNNASLVSSTKCIVAGIVQNIANTSGFGAPKSPKAPTRWFYQADVILNIKRIDRWTTGADETGKTVGQILHFEVKTSSLGMPYTTFDTYLRYGHGVDAVYEYIQVAIGCGLIEKAGAWYHLRFLETPEEKEVPKFHGAENLWEHLNENKEVYDKLGALISENMAAA